MPYDYQTERPNVFTEDGQRTLRAIRDRTRDLMIYHEFARCQDMIKKASGDAWTMLACVDRMVELGEIREITAPGSVAGQDRVFVRR